MSMQTSLLLSILTLSAALAARAQVEEPAAGAAVSAAAAANLSEKYAVVDRGANHRTWQRVEWEPTRSGRSIPHVHTVTELATGMHYLADGRWVESDEEIQLVANGALASKGPQKVGFTANINSPVSVAVRTPDNTLLKIRPLGLAYYDFHTRSNILIAELKDSGGQVVGANQVLYPDAFTGFRADVRYTYKKSGLEQDVILRERPPLPEDYGLNPATTWLWVLTEFIDAPADVTVARQVRRGWQMSTVDKIIRIGGMVIGHGTAFGLGVGQDRQCGVPLQKHWTVMDGRTILIEEVTFSRITSHLRDLQAGTGSARGTAIKRLASRTLSLPSAGIARHNAGNEVMQIAKVLPPENGLVLDFDLQSGTNIVLRGDMTYHVTGTVNLTDLVIEGGTVVKYDRDARINVSGTLDCLTSPYHPAVFTAVDDNSVGENLGTGTPTGTYADCALALGLGGELRHVNIRYANKAVYCANNDYSVNHAQLLFCNVGFHSETAHFTNGNILTYQIRTNFYGSHFHGRVEHLTANQARVLLHDWNFDAVGCDGKPSSSLDLVNTLTASITNGYAAYPVSLAIQDCGGVRDFPSGAGVFQAVVAGAHYLADGSTNRNAGTTNIQPALAAALKATTTYPPILYSNVTFSAASTFAPQAQRDTDAPDLGYHYDALDYVFGGVTANANLTFTPGTAVGWFRTSQGWYHAGHGIHAANNTIIQFNGTLEQPDYWARCNTVQEQPAYAGYGPGGITGWTDPSVKEEAPQLIARFTRCAMMNNEAGNTFRDDNGVLVIKATDCEFLSGGLGGYDSLNSFTNCLFRRPSIWLLTTETFPTMIMRNCTVRGGAVVFQHWEEGPEYFHTSFRETIFDGTILSTGYPDDPGCVDYDYNAFLTGNDRLDPQGANDVVVNSFNWQTGWLGNYYLPTNSPLINTGSITANLAGLYHYTTQTNQVKETNSVVDIGYHYVAVNPSSGLPYDYDGDGIADYLEDANGNGIATDDSTAWDVYNSANGLVNGSGLQVFTPLR